MDQPKQGAIPNRTGKVLTVRGPVDPRELGVTLTHEHIFIDIRKTHLPRRRFLIRDDRVVADPPEDEFPATELAQWEAKVDSSNLHLARSLAPIADNYVLSDQQQAVQEIREFKKHGGKTIVDVTSIGLKRDPVALRKVSEETDIHIIMGSSFYQRVYHPDDMDQRTVEDLTQTIVRDITVGVGDTEIRSGIVGEVGINGNPLIGNELKSMRAAARAARLTGAALCIHLGGEGAEKHTILDIAEEEGLDLNRIILGHSDDIATDFPFVRDLLARGVYVAFDNLRGEPEVVPGRTAAVALALPPLLDAGYTDRILLSQDICYKIHLKAYGGFGYSFLLETFLPQLRELGVSEEQIATMMVENAQRILTFEPPGV